MKCMALVIICLFLNINEALALELNQPIKIELGENLLLSAKQFGNFKKIWISDRTLLNAQIKDQTFYLKALGLGRTEFRLDNRLYKIDILPTDAKRSFKLWQKLGQQFVDIHVDYCESWVCLKGNLYRFEDYLRILKIIRTQDAKINLSLNLDNELQKKVREFVEIEIRKKGLTGQKIIFTTPWKIYYPKINSYAFEQFQFLGLAALSSSKASDIAENVKVAVKIVELSKSFERKLGVRWPDSFQAQIINNNKLETANAFDIALSAAEKSGDAHVLASPNLLCRSGKEAEFFAGGEFPIKVTNLRISSVSWKRYGIGLKFRPLIDSLGQLNLQIETEVSSVDRSITIDDMPALHVNRVSSYFDLINTRTIALSGLVKNESSENSEGLPWLKNIPILGSLFSSKNFIENKSELVVFVTPELMSQESY